jgi:hypothetical protein
LDVEGVDMLVSEELQDREARAAKNESRFREINERIERANEGFDFAFTVDTWICECTNEACAVRLQLSVEEYEDIRSDGTCFLVGKPPNLIQQTANTINRLGNHAKGARDPPPTAPASPNPHSPGTTRPQHKPPGPGWSRSPPRRGARLPTSKARADRTGKQGNREHPGREASAVFAKVFEQFGPVVARA